MVKKRKKKRRKIKNGEELKKKILYLLKLEEEKNIFPLICAVLREKRVWGVGKIIIFGKKIHPCPHFYFSYVWKEKFKRTEISFLISRKNDLLATRYLVDSCIHLGDFYPVRISTVKGHAPPPPRHLVARSLKPYFAAAF